MKKFSVIFDVENFRSVFVNEEVFIRGCSEMESHVNEDAEGGKDKFKTRQELGRTKLEKR